MTTKWNTTQISKFIKTYLLNFFALVGIGIFLDHFFFHRINTLADMDSAFWFAIIMSVFLTYYEMKSEKKNTSELQI